MEQVGRMATLLWFVGYCGDFPVQLVSRIGGHPEWNRHVMYMGIHKGLLTILRIPHRERIIRSLRITADGLQYLAENDPKGYNTVLAQKSALFGSHISNAPERVLRRHSEAIGLVMAERAGAVVMPEEKPSMLKTVSGFPLIPICDDSAYYYSMFELRAAIQQSSEDTSPRTARLVGIIIRGRNCWCIYHSGRSRMFWLQGAEENAITAIQSLLYARGFHCDIISQVIVGTTMMVATKLAKPQTDISRNYFCVSHFFNNCYFITNDALGDLLLSEVTNPPKLEKMSDKIMASYQAPDNPTRDYDAIDPETGQPVILAVTCDLQQLININPAPYGFAQMPVVLCFDYQAQAIQQIVGPMIMVRTV